jgi:type VI secretion system protein ImpA
MTELLALLNEVSAEAPCGGYLEYDPAYLELAKNIVGKIEDPITGEKAQPPNWRDIQKQSLALLQRSKDLQVVLYLLRSLIHLDGVEGFRDGLALLEGLLVKYWENIHPALDPDDGFDPTARVNIIEELSHFETVLRPLTLVPLVDSKALGRFCLRDVHIATDKMDVPEGVTKPDINIIKAAFLDITPETMTASYQALNESANLLKQLDNLVTDKVGIGNGPDLSAAQALLKEMMHVFDQYAPAGFTTGESVADDIGDAGGQQASNTSSVVRQQAGVGAINTRQDVLKTLDLLCKYYADHEPSSPVPILLQRAKHLVTSDFMQIVQNLLPDAVSQLEFFKGPDPDSN